MDALKRSLSCFDSNVACAARLSDEVGRDVHAAEITNWKRQGVPAQYWLVFERITEGVVRAEDFEGEHACRKNSDQWIRSVKGSPEETKTQEAVASG